MRRVALIIPSETYRATDFVEAAGALGVELVVASDRRSAMAAAMGDRSAVVDLDDPERAAAALEALAARLPFEAVVGVDDRGVLAASAVAERLGLRHGSSPAVGRARNKAATREALDRTGVSQPRWRLLEADADAGSVAQAVGLPCVVKPQSLSASRGVIRADTVDAARQAAQRVRSILDCAGQDRAAPLLIERYVPGVEVALEGLIRAGRLHVLALFDKPDPLEGPFFEETIYVTPSRHPDALQRAVIEAAERGLAALGLTEGPVHAEMRINDDGVHVLEIAARSIGGLCSRALRFGAGVSLEELILRHALDLDVGDLRPAWAASGVMMLPIPRRGVLRAVDGRDRARAVPGIEGLTITVPPGGEVVPLPEGDRYLGFLFARASSPGEVERAMRTAHRALEIRIDEPGAGEC